MKVLVFTLILSLPFGVFAESEWEDPLKDCAELCDWKFMEEATPEEIQKLIDEGYDVNGNDKWMSSRPLFRTSRAEIMEVLIENGADVNARDIDGLTPLHGHSFVHINIEAMKFLIENGADVNARDDRLRTPAHRIVTSPRREDSIKALGLLLFHGADIDARDEDGKSVRDYLIDFDQGIILF